MSFQYVLEDSRATCRGVEQHRLYAPKRQDSRATLPPHPCAWKSDSPRLIRPFGESQPTRCRADIRLLDVEERNATCTLLRFRLNWLQARVLIHKNIVHTRPLSTNEFTSCCLRQFLMARCYHIRQPQGYINLQSILIRHSSTHNCLLASTAIAQRIIISITTADRNLD